MQSDGNGEIEVEALEMLQNDEKFRKLIEYAITEQYGIQDPIMVRQKLNHFKVLFKWLAKPDEPLVPKSKPPRVTLDLGDLDQNLDCLTFVREFEKHFDPKDSSKAVRCTVGPVTFRITLIELRYYLGEFSKVDKQYCILRKALIPMYREQFDPYIRFQQYVRLRKTRRHSTAQRLYAISQAEGSYKVIITELSRLIVQGLFDLDEIEKSLCELMDEPQISNDMLLFYVVSKFEDLIAYITLVLEFDRLADK